MSYGRYFGLLLGVAGLGLGLGLWPQRCLQGQAAPAPAAPAPAQTVPAASAPPMEATPGRAPVPSQPAAKKRRSATTNGRLQRIQIEQAPPSPPSPDETPAQHAADQKLLQQQEAQSAQAAQVTNQQVRTAQERIDKVQDEQRIQDAPGPSQTGLVPAAGPPLLPSAGSSGTIQDAPAVQPAQPTTSPVQPQAPPAQPPVV